MLKEDRLLSVGIDIGTTTTHLVVTSLSFGKKSSAKSINDLCVTDKHVLFESAVYETPLAADGSIDAARVAELIGQAYKEAAQQANLDMTSVHTGAVIITGESARTRNAAEVLLEIAKFAGEFVVESAGPSLESILCARGSGAQALSKEDGRRILSLDVGGGTSNFALVEQGEITATAAISIGGRAIKFVDKKIASMSKTAALLSSSIGLTLTEGMGMVDCHAELSALANLMAQIIFDISSAGQALSDKIDIWLTPALTLEQRPELVLISGGGSSSDVRARP